MSEYSGPASRTHPREEGEWLDSMLVHICLGVAKEDSWTVTDAERSKLWDAMAADVAEIHAKGWQVAMWVDED